MSALSVAGLQLKNLTAYNEYITDIIIASIVYLSALSLVIKMFLSKRRQKKEAAPAEPADSAEETLLEEAEGSVEEETKEEIENEILSKTMEREEEVQ